MESMENVGPKQSAETKVEIPETDLETAKDKIKNLEESLNNSKKMIDMVSSMPAGMDKYNAAVKMRGDVEDSLGIKGFDLTSDPTLMTEINLNYSSLQPHPKEVVDVRQKLDEVKEKFKQTGKKMMEAWWNAKGEYEGGSSAEIAKDFSILMNKPVELDQAKAMLKSEALDDKGREYLSVTMMKSFIDINNLDEAADIAILARKDGYYRTMDIDSISGDVAKKLKNKNPTKYNDLKNVLGPNTKSYV